MYVSSVFMTDQSLSIPYIKKCFPLGVAIDVQVIVQNILLNAKQICELECVTRIYWKEAA